MEDVLERAQRLVGLASERGAAMAQEAWVTARDYLATEEGKRLRHQLAGAVIVVAPIVSELPVFRRTLFGRALRVAGLSALLVKGAEWLRDWEPASAG